MTTVAAQGVQPIAGYVLVDRLGSGAYGEVWRAEAPGGLSKAVKIVYGHHNEIRASRELQALERVKLLRHPFLLSLERIEIADGRLIIVTELADMSLKQRFHDCQAAGQPGIARDELLSHLRDAADALDYLNAAQSLQHLDVKAENFLLVGGRLKVGDFGLVRNLTECDAAMLEGMTPRYAAPEVFEGRPTKFSDQFSLAVVYAELISGQPPFDAKSPAQCAAQHLLGAKPKLDSLDPADQAIVRRALSKKPEDRFPSCRAFVDGLLAGAEPATCRIVENRGPRPEASPSTAETPVHGPDNGTGPAISNPAKSNPASRPSGSTPVAPHRASPAIEDMTLVISGDSSLRSPASCGTNSHAPNRLAAVEFDHLEWEPRPTLFVALGGAAAQIVRGLSKRVTNRFAASAAVPAWATLLIDTEAATPSPSTTEPKLADQSADEPLIVPLRTTQEYRAEAPQVLKWISRRWLYNIPRIPRTSGCRPLGRLALVDNGAIVIERLRQELQAFTSPAALTTSAAVVGTTFGLRPVIVLVASISGGSGSGMVLDLAYAVRKLAAEIGLADYELRGLLIHATETEPASQELALANSLACLTELAHFNRPGGGYPGEEALGISSVPSILPTFDETLVVHLGDGLGNIEFQERSQRIVDYLYHRLATRVGTLLDRLHTSAADERLAGSGEATIRTFGLYSADNLPGDVVEGYIARLCQTVAEKWFGTASRPVANDRNGAASGGDELSEKLKRLTELALGPSADRRFVRDVAAALTESITTTGVTSQAKLDLVLANCSEELGKLAASLRTLRDSAPTIRELQDRVGGSKTETPLFALHSAVQTFLQERVAELAISLGNDFPASFFQRQRRAGDGPDVAGQILQGLARQLRLAAQAEILKSLQQIEVTRLLLDLIEKSSAARDPLRGMLRAAGPLLSAAGAPERLFVFAPEYADTAALSRLFADDLQAAATVVSTAEPQLTVCVEREQISLRDVAATLIAGRTKLVELASRLHTRVDVSWAPLRIG